MTDERFDQILRQALSPRIEEDEWESLQQKREKPDSFSSDRDRMKGRFMDMKKRKVLLSAAAVAASTAIVLTGVGSHAGVDTLDIFSQKTGSEKKVAREGTSMNPAASAGNGFTMTVQAAERTELKKGKAVPVIQGGINVGESWGGDPKTHRIDYSVDAPLFCEGENIDKITYSINQGAFQVVFPKGSGFVLKGEEYQGSKQADSSDTKDSAGSAGTGDTPEMNVGNALSGDFDLESGKWEEKYYTSFTISADDQNRKDVGMGICDNRAVTKKVYDQLWGYLDKLSKEEASEDVSYAEYWDTPEQRAKEDAEKKQGEGNVATVHDQGTEVMSRPLETLKKGRDEVFKDIVITCTVTYKDGSTESADIKVGNKIMSLKEAEKTFLIEKEDGEIKQLREKYDKQKDLDKNWDSRDIYTTFQRQ